MIAELTAKETGVIGGAGEVSVVAHRVVHGGEKFTEGTLITDEVLAQIEALNPLAPLHNPVNVAGIREMRRLFPAVPHVAVFDTAFHHTLPAYAYLYGLPYELYEKKARAPLRLPRHVAPLRQPARRAVPETPSERAAAGELPSRQRLVALRRGSRALGGHDDGLHARRGADHGHALRRRRRRRARLPRTHGEASPPRRARRCSTRRAACSACPAFRATCAKSSRPPTRASTARCSRSRRIAIACGNTSALTSPSMGGLDAVIFTGGIGQGSAEVRALALQGLECMGITLDAQRNRDARGFDEVCRISDRRLEGGGARRAHRRGAHDGARGVAHVEPLLHHARARGAEAAAVSRRGLGASHPPHAGARRGAVRHRAISSRSTPTSRSPASMPARSSSPSSGRRAASSACACSGRRANTRRSRSR